MYRLHGARCQKFLVFRDFMDISLHVKLCTILALLLTMTHAHFRCSFIDATYSISRNTSIALLHKLSSCYSNGRPNVHRRFV